ncbi:hypothetical protein JCM33374_g3756 [Metschnikowia sp. JCM 33374]|nr:hypothetical protein JCM33374_g3756 [Metschnikowia sp. JCM 33374]
MPASIIAKSGKARAVTALRFHSSGPSPLYLNPHKWQGLPADRVFELHSMRRTALGEKYVPNDAERKAVLATYGELKASNPALSYGYEMDNFSERVMNNTPVSLRGLPKKYANVPVLEKGQTPHQKRKIEQIHRISAYEMPLLAKFRQPYQPSSAKETPLRLKFSTDFSEESTPINRNVTLFVNLKDLELNAQQQRKFKLLAEEKFDHNTNVFKFSTDRYPESTQNARWLVETFNKLLTEAKDLTKNTFDEVPLNIAQKKANGATDFPESWKRPQDAPIKRHRIVRECVDAVKQRMDAEYLKSLSP